MHSYRRGLPEREVEHLATAKRPVRSRTLAQPVSMPSDVFEIVTSMLAELFPVSRGIRLLGVTLSSLESPDQLNDAMMSGNLRSSRQRPLRRSPAGRLQ